MAEGYRNLPEATAEETDAYLIEAGKFITCTWLYSSYKGLAKVAIADYLAWKDGKQLKRTSNGS